MRFLFITAALLLFSCAMAAADDVDVADDQPLTEEQAEEIVFFVEEEMAKEIEKAVKTINEVFGNPACSNATEEPVSETKEPVSETEEPVSKRDLKVEKRGWFSKVWKKVKSKIDKTKDKVKSAIQKARLKLALAIAGKRSDAESELEVEKRGWGKKLWKKVKKAFRRYQQYKLVTAVVGKRSKAESEDEIQFRADIAKLESALEVLNDVLEIAREAAKSE